MKKITNYLLFINLCLWIGAGVYFALFRLPMTDDYYAAEVAEKGILGAIYNGAMNWDERYMTLSAFVQYFLICHYGWAGARLV